MIRPAYLRKGDTIGITAPAGRLLKREIEEAVDIFRSWDLKVVMGKHLFRRNGSFAGTDNERLEDLQEMIDNPRLNAIICARGGYGSIRIAERLNFDLFAKNPKWLVGYSDITVLHSALFQIGVESIHGPMPRIVHPARPNLVSFETLRSVLYGEVKEYSLKPMKGNRNGRGKGKLTGGNLSVLYSLNGTQFDIDTKGKILFIEDTGEYLYHIDRMMMNLKLSGKLEGLAGLIVGDMTDMKSSPSGFRKPAYEIIRESLADYDYPVVFGFPAGHGEVNVALVMGRSTTMIATEKNVELLFDPDY